MRAAWIFRILLIFYLFVTILFFFIRKQFVVELEILQEVTSKTRTYFLYIRFYVIAPTVTSVCVPIYRSRKIIKFCVFVL